MSKKALRNKMAFLKNSKYHVKAYKAKKMWLFAGLFALALGGSAVTANANGNVHADSVNNNSNHVNNTNVNNEQQKSTLVTNNADTRNNVNSANANNVKSASSSVNNNVTSSASSNGSHNLATVRMMQQAPRLMSSPNSPHNQQAPQTFTYNFVDATNGNASLGTNAVQSDGAADRNQSSAYNNLGLPYGYVYDPAFSTAASSGNTWTVPVFEGQNVYEFRYTSDRGSVGSSQADNQTNAANIDSLTNFPSGYVEGAFTTPNSSNIQTSSVYTSNSDGKKYFGNIVGIDIPVVQSSDANEFIYTNAAGSSVGDVYDTNVGNSGVEWSADMTSGYYQASGDTSLTNSMNASNSTVSAEYSEGNKNYIGTVHTYDIPVVQKSDGYQYKYLDTDNGNSTVWSDAVNTNNVHYGESNYVPNNYALSNGASASGDTSMNASSGYYYGVDGSQYYGKLTGEDVSLVESYPTYQYNYSNSAGSNEGSADYPTLLASNDMPEFPSNVKDGYYYNNGSIKSADTPTSASYYTYNGKNYFGSVTNENVTVASASSADLTQYDYYLGNNKSNVVTNGFTQSNADDQYHGSNTNYKLSGNGNPGAKSATPNKSYYHLGGKLYYGATNIYHVPVTLKGHNNANGDQSGNVPVNGDRLVGDLPLLITENNDTSHPVGTINLQLSDLLEDTTHNNSGTENNDSKDALYVGDIYHLKDDADLQNYIKSNYFNDQSGYQQTDSSHWTNPDLWLRFVNMANLKGGSANANDNYIELQAANTNNKPSTGDWNDIARVNGTPTTDNASDDKVDYDFNTNSFTWKDGDPKIHYNYTFNVPESANVMVTDYDGDLIDANKNDSSNVTSHSDTNTISKFGHVVRWKSGPKAGQAVAAADLGDPSNNTYETFENEYGQGINNNGPEGSHTDNANGTFNLGIHGMNDMPIDWSPNGFQQYTTDGHGQHTIIENNVVDSDSDTLSGSTSVTNDIPNNGTNHKVTFITPSNSDHSNKATMHKGDTIIVVPFQHEISNDVHNGFHYVIPTDALEIPTADNESERGTIDPDGTFVKDDNNAGNLNWTPSIETIRFYLYNPKNKTSIYSGSSITYKPSIQKGDYVGRNDIFSDTSLRVPESLYSEGYRLDPLAPNAHNINGQQYFIVPAGNGTDNIYLAKGNNTPHHGNDPWNPSDNVPIGPSNPGFNPHPGVPNNNGGNNNNPFVPSPTPIPPDNPDTPANPRQNTHHNIIPSDNHGHFDPNNPDDHGGMVPEGPNGTLVPAEDVPAIRANFALHTSIQGNDGGSSFDNINVPVDIDITTANNTLGKTYELNEQNIRQAIVNYMINHGYTDYYGQKGDLWDDSIIDKNGQEGQSTNIYYQIRQDQNGDYHIVQVNDSNVGDFNDNAPLVGNGSGSISIDNYMFRPSEAILNYHGKTYTREANGTLEPVNADGVPYKVESVKAEGYLGMELDPASNHFIQHFFDAKGWTLNNVNGETMPKIQLDGDDHTLYHVNASIDNNKGLVKVGPSLYGAFYPVANGKDSQNSHAVEAIAPNLRSIRPSAKTSSIRKVSNLFKTANRMTASHKLSTAVPSARLERKISVGDAPTTPTIINGSASRVINGGNNPSGGNTPVNPSNNNGNGSSAIPSNNNHGASSNVTPSNHGNHASSTNSGNTASGSNPSSKANSSNVVPTSNGVPSSGNPSGNSSNVVPNNSSSQSPSINSSSTASSNSGKVSPTTDVEAATLNYYNARTHQNVNQVTLNGANDSVVPINDYSLNVPAGYHLASSFNPNQNLRFGANDQMLNVPIIPNGDNIPQSNSSSNVPSSSADSNVVPSNSGSEAEPSNQSGSNSQIPMSSGNQSSSVDVSSIVNSAVGSVKARDNVGIASLTNQINKLERLVGQKAGSSQAASNSSNWSDVSYQSGRIRYVRLADNAANVALHTKLNYVNNNDAVLGEIPTNQFRTLRVLGVYQKMLNNEPQYRLLVQDNNQSNVYGYLDYDPQGQNIERAYYTPSDEKGQGFDVRILNHYNGIEIHNSVYNWDDKSTNRHYLAPGQKLHVNKVVPCGDIYRLAITYHGRTAYITANKNFVRAI